MALNVDLHIVNGKIVDPAQNRSETGELLIKDCRIVRRNPGETVRAKQTVDAAGCLVTPGLIDYHAHVFPGGTDGGISADAALLPMGVTTAVDAGSCGAANYESFLQTAVAYNRMRIYALLNVSSSGIVTAKFPENVDPNCFDNEKIRHLFTKYPDRLLGLKMRTSQSIVKNLGLHPLKASVALAEQLDCPLVVHVTDPPVPTQQLADCLRNGDVFCHVHQSAKETILSADGKVKPELIAAQKRGVCFDAANGRNNFALPIARQAIAEGFLPDIISSDVTAGSLFGDIVFGLPFVLMKYLSIGMSLEQVIRAATAAPAKQMGMSESLGTLREGAFADIAIFRLEDRPFTVRDKLGNTLPGHLTLVPQMTILDGKIVFKQIYF